MKPQKESKTPEAHETAFVSGHRMSAEELAEHKEWLRKHPPVGKPARKDLATIFRHCADRITEDAERFAFRQNDPARAERYDFWRELVQRKRVSARKQFPNSPALPEMPSLTGNDFYALADYCTMAADVLDGRKAKDGDGGQAGAGKGEAEDLQPTLGGKSLQDVSATQEAKEYDAFLCHASEDKDAIVRPFAEAMEQQGLKPWFDKAEVRWGDSLVKKINYGLSRSKLVVVFVSPDFLGKKAWSEKEFNAAMSMEVNGKTVVLPLLCGVTRDQIQQHYPVISDKVYREVPEYTAASKTEPSRLEPLVGELRQRIAERG